ELLAAPDCDGLLSPQDHLWHSPWSVERLNPAQGLRHRGSVQGEKPSSFWHVSRARILITLNKATAFHFVPLMFLTEQQRTPNVVYGGTLPTMRRHRTRRWSLRRARLSGSDPSARGRQRCMARSRRLPLSASRRGRWTSRFASLAD